MFFRTDGSARALVLSSLAAGLMLLTAAATGRLAAQQDATVTLLQELTNANGAPGFEGPVRTLLKRHWQGFLKDLRTDGLGNRREDDSAAVWRRSEGDCRFRIEG